MHRLRILTLLVLALTLPGYGLAGLGHVRGCDHAMGQMGSQAAAPLGCCAGGHHGMSGGQSTGHPVPSGQHGTCPYCSGGLSCNAPQALESSAIDPLLGAPAHTIPASRIPILTTLHSPDGLWRPPPLI